MSIQIHQLSKKYVRNGSAFFAVNNINIKVEAGEYISITGESGSGKSTLFHMTGGLLEPSEGKVLIDGKDIYDCSFKERTKLRNSKIGYILQGQNLLNNFNVLDNVCMPYYLSRQSESITLKAMGLLERVGLLSMKDSFPSELSGGEMRRVSIARALINNPSYVIADEPTGSLDDKNTEIIMKLFQDISNDGTAVVVSTHNLSFLNYSKKRYHMDKGILLEI